MYDQSDKIELSLIIAIVNCGLGTKVYRIAKNHGVAGGTTFLGRGTSGNHFLEILALSETKKEIVLMMCSKAIGQTALEQINKELKLNKPNHGIAFTLPIECAVGCSTCNDLKISRSDKKMQTYKTIFTIVEKGKAEIVIEAASKAGSRGGTIINARGSGIHETSHLFHLDIEPEKEVVLIISEDSAVEKITQAIAEAVKIDEPGNGIIFIQSVDQVFGLR